MCILRTWSAKLLLSFEIKFSRWRVSGVRRILAWKKVKCEWGRWGGKRVHERWSYQFYSARWVSAAERDASPMSTGKTISQPRALWCGAIGEPASAIGQDSGAINGLCGHDRTQRWITLSITTFSLKVPYVPKLSCLYRLYTRRDK